MSYRLGVDLGTTFTAAAVANGGPPSMLGLGNRALQVPSVLYLPSDGETVVGEAAERRGITDPSRVVREFKRRIGDHVPILVAGVPYSPQMLTAQLLRWVVRFGTEQMGEPPIQVVLTYPANWGPYKREILDQVVELADVGDVTTCSEPEAAAVQYAAKGRVPAGTRIAMYDLGGGTFDTCVLEKRPDGGFAMLGEPIGIEHLGGIDFDDAVFQHVLKSVGDAVSELDSSDPDLRAGLARLRRDCVDAKEALSSDVQAVIPVSLPGRITSVRLTRSELEELIRPPLEETVAAVGRAMRSAGVQASDLHSIVLVGGGSRIPLVRELLQQTYSVQTALDTHPKHDVALGAVQVGTPSVKRQPPAPKAQPTAKVQPPATAQPPASAQPTPKAQPPVNVNPPVTASPSPTPLPPVISPPVTTPPPATPTPDPPTADLDALLAPPDSPPPAAPMGESPAPAESPVPTWYSELTQVVDRPNQRDDGMHDRLRRPWLVALALITAVALGVSVTLALLTRGGDDTSASTPGQTGSQTPAAVALPASTPLTDQQLLVPMKIGENTDIYLADAELDAPVKRLTSQAGSDTAPSLSPDRRSAIYVHIEGRRTLRVMAVDGTGDRALFAKPPSFCVNAFRLAWNPVQPTMLAIACDDGKGNVGLYLVRTNGQVLRKLPIGQPRVDDPGFSPDGKSVTYWAGPESSLDGGSIYTIPIDGGEPQRFTQVEAGSDADPAWSPNGEFIVFRRRLPNGTANGNFDIFVVPTDGSQAARPLIAGIYDDQDPSWSPEGDQLAIKSNQRVAGDGADGRPRVWLVRLSETTPRLLWTSGPDGEQSTPAWTPR